MKIHELIGKTITNICTTHTIMEGWLDNVMCYIELDHEIIIDIPYGFQDEVTEWPRDRKAKSLFADLSDYPVYHINKEGKSIEEIVEKYKPVRRKFTNRLLKFLFGIDVEIKEYRPYKVEYRENKLKYIKNSRIVDYIWNKNDDFETGFLLLDNGYLITSTLVAPCGTGKAGLNMYESINDMPELLDINYASLTAKLKRE